MGKSNCRLDRIALGGSAMKVNDLICELLMMRDACGGDAEVFVTDMNFVEAPVLKSIQEIDSMIGIAEDGTEQDVKIPVIGI